MSDGRHAGAAVGSDRERQLALVLWSGDLGGAETLNAELADQLRQLGARITVLFVGNPWPLAERLVRADIPYSTLGLARGRDMLLHPRRYAHEVARVGADGALLMERGLMATALRAGGYRGPIVAVEHGALLVEQQGGMTPRRLVRRFGRFTGAWVGDSEVAVSDFMLEQMHRHAHAKSTMRIYNGIDPNMYRLATASPPDRGSELLVGFAGRLVVGKGADHLIRAIAELARRVPVKLVIAGEGPERLRLMGIARELGVESSVEFLGVVDDMPGFWRRCDIAAIPSDTWVESFSMVTLEAMSCGKAIVATQAGAIPELVLDGECGTLVSPGDVGALTTALLHYAENPQLRSTHGDAARARAIERFHIEDCARAYIALFDGLSATLEASSPRRGGRFSKHRRESHSA
jgi:glycosyltransferase involved in cell wall biosynthesis